MSNYVRAAYHPGEGVVRSAMWIDNHFGRHSYGVQFDGDDRVYQPADVEIPLGVVFAPKTVPDDWTPGDRFPIPADAKK